MDFTQIPVSQEYKYLLVMIDTFTGWIEDFPTWTEKAEEVEKKKNCSMKSFQDLVCPGHYKVTSFTSKVTQGVSKALCYAMLSHCSRFRLCVTL